MSGLPRGSPSSGKGAMGNTFGESQWGWVTEAIFSAEYPGWCRAKDSELVNEQAEQGWMGWVSKMEQGILKPSRLYYQQLFIFKCLFHCRHCSQHSTHFILPRGIRWTRNKLVPPCLATVSLGFGVPRIKWADHITFLPGLCVCVEWGAKLQKVKESLGGGEAGITGLWGSQSGSTEVKARSGSRIFFKEERLTYG